MEMIHDRGFSPQPWLHSQDHCTGTAHNVQRGGKKSRVRAGGEKESDELVHKFVDELAICKSWSMEHRAHGRTPQNKLMLHLPKSSLARMGIFVD